MPFVNRVVGHLCDSAYLCGYCATEITPALLVAFVMHQGIVASEDAIRSVCGGVSQG